MANIIINLSKYIILLMMILYGFSSFTVIRKEDGRAKDMCLNRQIVYVFVIHFLAYLTFSIQSPEDMVTIITFYGIQIFIATMYMYLYHYFYPYSSRMITNNMCFLLLIGYIMLTRLNFALAKKQFIIATASLLMVSIIPFILSLSTVFVLGKEQYGSVNWISIGGMSLQPSEFVKILFVFFIASMLSKKRDFRQVVITTILAGIHMCIIALEKDLGAALIFFVIFIFMVYVGTGKFRYFLIYIAGGVMMVGLAFTLFKERLFSHVMVRVTAWKDPWSDISGSGYQITQSLFAIGSGGYFGSGLTKGSPDVIPVSESDFIFSAIAEEMGVIFAIFLILVCFSCFIGFISIAMRAKSRFYKTMALGFSICYIFQTFLSIGGVTKFIPSTGVTIPLVSYGGSSVMSSLVMFSIMQGISTLENKEAKKVEEERRRLEEQTEYDA